jgi:hypothetical protein
MMIRPTTFLCLVLAAMLMNVSAVLAQTAPQTGQESRIAVEIARLGSSIKTDSAASVKALITIGKPAAPALVKALGDPRSNVRAFAAEALCSILAADPPCAPNYHEKAFWERRLVQLKSGMPLAEALKVLLPELSPAARQEASEGGTWSGGGGTESYRLDDYWVVAIYLVDFEHRKLHDEAPALVRQVCAVWVDPPDNYTGDWVTWHVNGQKAHDIQYRNGKYDGTFTACYDDDGSRCYQQHYTAGVCHGTDTGWHRNGKRAYEGQYEHGKQTGIWRWWNENGQVVSVVEYAAGKRIEKKGK